MATLIRFVLIGLPLLVSAGCQRSPPSPVPEKQGALPMPDPAKDKPRVQVPIGEGNLENWGLLPFDVLKVYPNQKPTDAAPWHVDGGDWTFFDCRTALPRPAVFTVGVRTKSKDGRPFAWGEATIVVANRGAGAKLLDSIGRSFKQKPPPERVQQSLEFWKFNTAVLGNGLEREPQGGFSGQGGKWSATKWFLERDGFSAEVFFNYNLQEMKGEFGEKDPNYREDLLAVLAIAVRDGPRPERTPQTDPNLTDVGPKFGTGRLVAKNARFFLFSPGGKHIVWSSESQDGSTGIFAVRPDQPDQPIEAARLRQELDNMIILDPDADQLLVVEALRKEKGVISSEDPKRLWWFDRTKQEARELKGPWQNRSFHLGEKPVSPDGRFIVIEDWRARTNGKPGNYSVIHVLDRQAGTAQTIELANQSPEPIGWVGIGKDLRLAFLKSHRWEKDVKQEWCLAEPATGKYTPVEKPPMPTDGWVRRLSPDGALIAAVEGKDILTIADVKTGRKRSFPIHEDDRRFLHEEGFEWVSARYLLMHLNRPAFLDVRTMKMSYRKDGCRNHTFSPDFKWVLWQKPDDDGVYVSSVVAPQADPWSSKPRSEAGGGVQDETYELQTVLGSGGLGLCPATGQKDVEMR
jgi:hypothetical protein